MPIPCQRDNQVDCHDHRGGEKTEHHEVPVPLHQTNDADHACYRDADDKTWSKQDR